MARPGKSSSDRSVPQHASAPVHVVRRHARRPALRLCPRPAAERRSGRRRRPVRAGDGSGAGLCDGVVHARRSPRIARRHQGRHHGVPHRGDHRSRRSQRRRPAPDAARCRRSRRHAADLCDGAVRSICAEVRGGTGRRSRLSRPGAAAGGGARRARRFGPAAGIRPRHRSRLRHRACRARLRKRRRRHHRHRSVAAHDRARPLDRALRRTRRRRDRGRASLADRTPAPT